MSRTGGFVLTVVGLASACVGAFIGFAYGVPALGLSQHGRNPVETTAVGEGLAALFYFFGAILEIRGGRVLAQPQRPARKVLLVALGSMGLALVVDIVRAAWNGDWEAILLGLAFVVVIVAPILAGMLSVWMVSGSPRSRGGGARSRQVL